MSEVWRGHNGWQVDKFSKYFAAVLKERVPVLQILFWVKCSLCKYEKWR